MWQIVCFSWVYGKLFAWRKFSHLPRKTYIGLGYPIQGCPWTIHYSTHWAMPLIPININQLHGFLYRCLPSSRSYLATEILYPITWNILRHPPWFFVVFQGQEIPHGNPRESQAWRLNWWLLLLLYRISNQTQMQPMVLLNIPAPWFAYAWKL